ncbi:MAG: hypothetical protein AAFP82_15355 [Bacteroidota bacterium]
MTKTYCFWFKFCCLFSFATAQQIENAFHWENEALLSFQSLAFSEESTFVGGVFQTSIESLMSSKESIGGNDTFLAQIEKNGEIIWLQTGGSSENDELTKIVHANGQIYAIGIYWVNGVFGDIQLNTKKGSKSIFLLNYDTQGRSNWGISIDGSSNKNVSDLAVDHEGNLLLTGSFRDSLFVQEQAVLFAEQQSFFLIKFDPNGNLIWAKKAKNTTGKIEGIAIGITENNDAILTGNFIGQLEVETATIETNTEDENVFVVAFSADGAFLWLRSAGGVFPDEVADVQCFEGKVYLAGNYFGRLEMSESIIIESLGLNENIFLLTFDYDGLPLSAQNIGDVDLEHVTSIDIVKNQMVLGGFFQERMKIEDFTITGEEGILNGFVLGLDSDSEPLWLYPFNSTDNLLVNEVHFDPQIENRRTEHFR